MNTSTKYGVEAEKIMRELEKKAKLSHRLSLTKSNEIVSDFGRVLEGINKGNNYPSMYYPESILPKSKSTIQEAFAVCFANSINESIKHSLYVGYCFLFFFIKDEEANMRNEIILSNPKFWKLIRKK